jgi:hypothetical protein
MAYIRRSSPSKQKEWKAIVKNYWRSLGKKYNQNKNESEKEPEKDED